MKASGVYALMATGKLDPTLFAVRACLEIEN